MFKTTQNLSPKQQQTLNTNARSFYKLALLSATSVCGLGYVGKYLTNQLNVLKNSNNSFKEGTLGQEDHYQTRWYAPIRSDSFNTGRKLLSDSNYRVANVYDSFQMNSYSIDVQDYPSLVGLAGGKFVATWTSYAQDGSYNGIYANIFNNLGVSITNEFKVNNYTVNSQNDPCVSGLSNNGFVITWSSLQDINNDYGVYGQIYTINGNMVGKEFRVNTYVYGNQDNARVVGLQNGCFVVVWESQNQDGSYSGIYGQMFNNDGSALGNEFRINTYTSSYQSSPCIASFSNGNFVVAWSSLGQDGSGYGIYAQIFDGYGAKVGREFRVNQETADDQYRPSLASLINDKFVIAWQGSNKVLSRIYSISGDPLSAEFISNSQSSYLYSSPKVTGLPGSNYFVVAHDFFYNSYSYGGIEANLFDETGAKLGEASYIYPMGRGSTTNYAKNKAIVNLTNNNFLISWAYEEVFGQLFNLITSSPSLTMTSTNSFSHTQTNTPTLTFSAPSRLLSVSSSSSASPQFSFSPKSSPSPQASASTSTSTQVSYSPSAGLLSSSPKNSLSPLASSSPSPISPAGYVVKSESTPSSPPSPSPLSTSVGKDYTSSACMNKPLLTNFIKSTRTNTKDLFNYAKSVIDVWMYNSEERDDDQTIINKFSKLKI